MMERTEDIIIHQLKSGNEHAYKFLYDNHYPILCHIANQYVHDDFLAQTIVGDTIFHIWERKETLDIQSSIRSYLVESVRNRCYDYLKSRYHQKEIALSRITKTGTADLGSTLSDQHPLGHLLEQELEKQIETSINRLPETCRQVFKLSRFEKKSYVEIADIMGISVNTVKYHIKRALFLLHADLDKYLATFPFFLFFYHNN